MGRNSCFFSDLVLGRLWITHPRYYLLGESEVSAYFLTPLNNNNYKYERFVHMNKINNFCIIKFFILRSILISIVIFVLNKLERDKLPSSEGGILKEFALQWVSRSTQVLWGLQWESRSYWDFEKSLLNSPGLLSTEESKNNYEGLLETHLF